MPRTPSSGLALPVVLAVHTPASDVWASELMLLNVRESQIPNDTGQNDKTKFSLETSGPLGGRALKVVFARGDSFGMSRSGVFRDWKRFATIEFEALNPSDKSVRLELAVKHRRSTSYQTQIRHPLVLKPGKNSVRIGIDGLSDVNGGAPDLAVVRQWYFADVEKAAPTLYFGNIRLTGHDANAPTVARTGALPSKRTIKTDPARTKRIRNAKMPKIVEPVRFDTPEADAILSALEIFPPDHPINELITDWPLHPHSRAIIESVGARKKLRYNADMAFVIVPPSQKRIAVEITHYPGESDKGPFPIPDAMPIEGWPATFRRGQTHRDMTLRELQEDFHKIGGDRHALVVDPTNRMLYEFYIARRGKTAWQAAQASVFDLKTNRMRPDGWTSTDAAGLPVFPTVVRYDELRRGIVEHAMRVTIRNTRRAYVFPARHHASRHENETYPRMGERFRLKPDFDIGSFSPEVKAILRGLKRYGMLVADNGIEWAISVSPDPRIPSLHEELSKIRGSDFEVVIAPPVGESRED